MKEVSCSALSPFFERARREGVPFGRLSKGVPLSLAKLQSSKERLDWEHYCTFLRNVADIWTHQELSTFGLDLVRAPFVRFVAVLAQSFFTLRELYGWLNGGQGGVGREMFTCINPTFRALADNHFVVVLEMADGYQMSPEFAQISKGHLSAVPAALGLPPAEVELQIGSNFARFEIRAPEDRTFIAGLRRTLRWPLSSVFALRELKDAHELLLERITEIESARTALANQAARLETAHSISQTIHSELDLEETLARVAESLVNVAGFVAARVVLFANQDLSERSAHRGAKDVADVYRQSFVLESRGYAAGMIELWFPKSGNTQTLSGLVEFLMPTIAMALENGRAYEVKIRQMQLLEDLRRATREREAAQLASQMKSEFVAQISHELRTPLGAVLATAQLLSETSLDSAQRRYVGTLRSSGESLMSILNDTLDLSKIEAGKLVLSCAHFDLLECIEEVTELMAPVVHSKGVELVLDIAPDFPRKWRGDGLRLRQVLLNLIGNAAKFTNRGEIVLRVSRRGDWVRFEVSDTGIGMSTEQLRRLFQAFVQGHQPVWGGTGLGLVISRQLVELMGGEIEVSSVEGEGSVFHFSLPLELMEVKEEIPDFRHGGRVLVADGHALSRSILVRQLSYWRANVSQVGNASEFAEALKAGSFAAILAEEKLLDEAYRSEPHLAQMQSRIIRMRYAARVAYGRQEDGTAMPKPTRRDDLLASLRRSLGVPDAVKPSEVPPVVRYTQAASVRVLVAEDNPVNQMLIATLLGELGCSVDIAKTGLEAVALFQRNFYNLVFMDRQLPEMDGLEATRRIRKLSDRGVQTPIIAMTASALKGEREQGLAAGMDDYVTKPIRPNELRVLVDRWTRPERGADSRQSAAGASVAAQ